MFGLKQKFRRYLPRLYSALDRVPTVGSAGDGDLSLLAGWVFHSRHPVILTLFVAGKPSRSIIPSLIRRDVADVYPEFPQAALSGFELSIPEKLVQGSELELRAAFGDSVQTLWSLSKPEEALDPASIANLVYLHFPEAGASQPHSERKELHIIVQGHAREEIRESNLEILRNVSLPPGFSWGRIYTADEELETGGFPWKAGDGRFQLEDSSSKDWYLSLPGKVPLAGEDLKRLFQPLRGKYPPSVSTLGPCRIENRAREFARVAPIYAGSDESGGCWVASSGFLKIAFSGTTFSHRLPKWDGPVYCTALNTQFSDAHRSSSSRSSGNEPVIENGSLLIILPIHPSDEMEKVVQDVREEAAANGLNASVVFDVDDPLEVVPESYCGLPCIEFYDLMTAKVGSENQSVVIFAASPETLTSAFLLRSVLGGRVVSNGFETVGRSKSSLLDCREWSENSRCISLSEIESFAELKGEEPPWPEREGTEGERGITAIIPVYGALEVFSLCIRSVLNSLGEDDEVVIVDDCSGGESQRFIDVLGTADQRISVVRHEENLGFIEACYSGLKKAAPGNDVLLVNSDVVVTREAVEAVRAAAQGDRGIVCSLSTGSRNLELPLQHGHSLFSQAKALFQGVEESFHRAITPEGQFLLIRRWVIERFGFFDRVYGRGFCEESDLSMRAFLHGVEIGCAPKGLVWHQQSASFGSQERIDRIRENRPIFDARWGRAYELSFQRFQKDHPLQHVPRALVSRGSDIQLATPLHSAADIRAVSSLKPSAQAHEQLARAISNGTEVFFLLSSVRSGGGSLSVLQHCNELLLRGIEARVISLSEPREIDFPILAPPIFTSVPDLMAADWSDQKIVATFWTTAYVAAELVHRSPGLRGFYYVQDFEPNFYSDSDSEMRELAEKSYSLPLKKAAKTHFLKETVKKETGAELTVISPGIDRTVFYPSEVLRQHRPTFAALYRPSTPRRGAAALERFLEVLLEQVPEAQVRLFGESGELPLGIRRRVQGFEQLPRGEIAEIYRRSDFVVDLSSFHGFGRMGIEGMACGCVPILTDSGGVREYSRDGENCLMVKPETPEESVSRAIVLWQEEKQYGDFRERALQTASQWSEQRAVNDWLPLLGIARQPDPGLLALWRALHSESLPKYRMVA